MCSTIKSNFTFLHLNTKNTSQVTKYQMFKNIVYKKKTFMIILQAQFAL